MYSMYVMHNLKSAFWAGAKMGRTSSIDKIREIFRKTRNLRDDILRER